MPNDEEMITLIKNAAQEGQFHKISAEELESVHAMGVAFVKYRPYDLDLIYAVNQFKAEIESRKDGKVTTGIPSRQYGRISSPQIKGNCIPDITYTSPSTGMKACPFCAEKINEKAIKCKHCGSMLDDSTMPQKKSSGLSAQTIQQISFQTNFTLIPNEHILIDGLSSYLKSTWNIRSGYAYLTNYRLIFCSNAMNSTVGKVFVAGAVGAVARQVFKATKINFQVPLSEISSLTKEKWGFSSKYTISTKSNTTYTLKLPKGDKWMSIMQTLGVKCIV